jgi:hypothetical protein
MYASVSMVTRKFVEFLRTKTRGSSCSKFIVGWIRGLQPGISVWEYTKTSHCYANTSHGVRKTETFYFILFIKFILDIGYRLRTN